MDNNEEPVNGPAFYMISNLCIIAFVLINMIFIINVTTDIFAGVTETVESYEVSSLFGRDLN